MYQQNVKNQNTASAEAEKITSILIKYVGLCACAWDVFVYIPKSSFPV